MIIDAHTHLFTPKIIANVARKSQLVNELSLETDKAAKRCSLDDLEEECKAAGVGACLLLPTASPRDVQTVNQRFLEFSEKNPFFISAGTLHPENRDIDRTLELLSEKGVKVIKMCSFSQGFDLDDPETLHLFEMIRERGSKFGEAYSVVLDTFYKADLHFDSDDRHITTPERLGRLVSRFPEIRFLAAHMGGLSAPFSETMKHLMPSENLYLDTSNAAHTLSETEFVELLEAHGSERIIFGTDWPWFGQGTEIPRIERLLAKAGFDEHERDRVFYGNIAELLSLSPVSK